jgi:hypothetical protein
VNFSRYTVDMYGITTVKPPLTILGISWTESGLITRIISNFKRNAFEGARWGGSHLWSQLLQRHRSGGIKVQGQSRKKSETTSQPIKPGMVVHAQNPNYARGVGMRITVRDWSQAEEWDPTWKIN